VAQNGTFPDAAAGKFTVTTACRSLMHHIALRAQMGAHSPLTSTIRLGLVLCVNLLADNKEYFVIFYCFQLKSWELQLIVMSSLYS
jgi:hypothetical protein